MTPDETLYLIDGSSYIYRAYYAIRHLSSPSGYPTNAIYGFIQMLLKLLKDYQPKFIPSVAEKVNVRASQIFLEELKKKIAGN